MLKNSTVTSILLDVMMTSTELERKDPDRREEKNKKLSQRVQSLERPDKTFTVNS